MDGTNSAAFEETAQAKSEGRRRLSRFDPEDRVIDYIRAHGPLPWGEPLEKE